MECFQELTQNGKPRWKQNLPRELEMLCYFLRGCNLGWFEHETQITEKIYMGRQSDFSQREIVAWIDEDARRVSMDDGIFGSSLETYRDNAPALAQAERACHPPVAHA